MIRDLKQTEFGDADLDHDVDAADLAAVRTHFGQAGGWSAANVTLDKDVDAADLALVRSHFGFSTGPSPAPEPGPLIILLFSVWLIRRAHPVEQRSQAVRRADT